MSKSYLPFGREDLSVRIISIERFVNWSIPGKQTEQNYERWQKVSDNIVVTALNPYDKSNAPDKAAQYLKENGAEVVVLDCMGFTIAIKEKMAELMGVPVILPRTLVARVVGEML